jgi:uncharacterized protein (TIGR03435 family)
MRRPAFAAIVIFVLVAEITAQQSTFAVASIKATKLAPAKKPIGTGSATNTGNVMEPPRGDRVIARGATVRTLVRYAFGDVGSNGQIVRPMESERLVGGPEWIDTAMFDIDARMDVPARGPMELMTMMQQLLEERFRLRAHRDTRELPVFELVFARSDHRPGPQLNELITPCAPIVDRVSREEVPCAVRTAPGRLTGHGVAMAAVATYLSPVVGRVVIDRTGLTGRFDVALTFAPTTSAVPEPNAGLAADAPSVFVAVQEQLGLRLVGGRAPVEVVIIDRVEWPTDN